MRVRVSALDAVEIAQLEVVESEGAAVHQGAQVGFICLECQQCDETLDQIWHDQSCRYAGEHGRSHYADLEPVVEAESPTPEFDDSHEITVVTSASTDDPHGIHNGEVLAFRCGCGNLDEHLFEVVHDERCHLAGRHDAAGDGTCPVADH